jgi:hypothetical protein
MAHSTDGRRGGWTAFDSTALAITIIFAVALWWLAAAGYGPADLTFLTNR